MEMIVKTVFYIMGIPVMLTHWGLVTAYGDNDLGEHWLRYWLVAWRHQAITWTNVDLSSVWSSGIHLRSISSEIPQPPFTKVSLKITYLKLNWNLPGANELRQHPHIETSPWCPSAKVINVDQTLTHRGWVTHIYVSTPGHHYFR